jgi:hypothetical protein
MVDWLSEIRGRKSESIESAMRRIHALLMQHPDFNEEGEDERKREDKHRWLLEKLASLAPEPKQELYARKNAKSIPHSELAKVPVRIEELIAAAKSGVEIAWLKHDLLFFRWTLCHPWRGRNLRECSVDESGRGNLVNEPLPLDLRRRRTLPSWAARRLKNNNEASFLRIVFDEEYTKGNYFVEELVARELVPLYREYVDKHRPTLLGKDKPDPGTLFLDRRLKAMTGLSLRRLYTRLTEQYIGRRSTPHLNRDSFSEHHLETGGDFATLQSALWQVQPRTTWRYCRRFNPSNGAVALDRHLRAKTQSQE